MLDRYLNVQGKWIIIGSSLLHCLVARELCVLVFSLFGVKWVMLRTVVDCLACWRRKCGMAMRIEIWNATPSCLIWTIWLKRNN